MRKEGAVSLRNNPCFISERWQNDRLRAKNFAVCGRWKLYRGRQQRWLNRLFPYRHEKYGAGG